MRLRYKDKRKDKTPPVSCHLFRPSAHLHACYTRPSLVDQHYINRSVCSKDM